MRKVYLIISLVSVTLIFGCQKETFENIDSTENEVFDNSVSSKKGRTLDFEGISGNKDDDESKDQ